MSDTRNTTCEERVAPHLASRIEDIEAIYNALNNDGGEIDGEFCDYEAAYERLQGLPLAVEIKSTLVVQISAGGPSEQFEIEVERGLHGGWVLNDNEATYRFLDWFDGATRRTDNEAIMAMLSNFAEIMYEE
jgi:shikimate 5-dehydrogenase